ncbi:MCE family protein [Duganella sp. BJB488]|uniref:MlaD family protein n=1 Tax=unclassified Duganella TaxID=2636909 RepID=UPI000E354227|nr:MULTISPECIES: MlaD family protein [unclassified Duganella]NVD72681.1 MCE family protein [Duganella sp. BJB1802]RFP20288.1 MCE family protein [Duganella sp. BJB489]RFP21266.1 MCE family protein [Duganella sp. BJB488]RFP33408.1 MCE family protein [Duganella sp. BJB480]
MTEQTNEAAPVRNAEFKALLLLVLMVVLVAGSALYLLYARGAFEATQTLVLQTDNSEGVTVGMDVTFAGFPIGRVRRIELGKDGNARVIVDVPRSDAHWLRSTSIFTLERGLVGGAKLRAFSGIPTDPPLEDGATRTLLVGDAGAEIPRLLAAAKDLLENLNALTAENSALAASLANVQGVTGKLNGPGGAMGLIAGDDKNAQQLAERANKLLITVNALATKADSLIGHADTQVFGKQGVMTDAQATIVQLNGLLADARNSLKKMDAVLVEAQAVGANAKEATADLGTLRGEVESSLRRVEQLVNEINRKWPFKRDTEIKLP